MKPTHRLRALNKTTGTRGEVGAGWLNENGSISIRLNPCVILDDDPNIVITLFLADDHDNGKAAKGRFQAKGSEESGPPY